ncbi:MAG: carboxypeptidase-like regulatory domain-containing protein [Limnohabitans sp.]
MKKLLNQSWSNMPHVVISVAAAMLTGCGGGGNTASVAVPALSGTVAIGAPATNADVTVQDAKGNTVAAKTDGNGQFSIELSQVTGPAIMSVLLSDGRKMYSIWDGSKQGSFATTNITPLTDAVVSEYAKAKNVSPANITPNSVDTIELKTAKETVKAWIVAAYQKTGGDASQLDLMSTPFQASGKGLDAVLDSLSFTRDSQGLTVLYPKEVILADGASPAAPTPLSASHTLTSVSSGDTVFPLSQLGSWRSRMNDCMTIQVTARAASASCAGISPLSYKHDSVNFQTHMFSDTNENNSVGAVFEYPRLLSLTQSPSAAAVDTALVELRWYQPLTQTTHSRVGVFRDLGESGRLQDNKVASATGSTWWLYGNQNDLEIRIEPRLSRYENLNPDSQSTSPSLYFAGIHILINNYKQVNGTWVSANLMAAKVTGPGLPASGLVLAPVDPDLYSSSYLGILNRTGQMPTSMTYAPDSVNEFRLGATPINAHFSLSDLDSWWTTQSAKSAFYNATRVQDFSGIQSQANYNVQLVYSSGQTESKNIRLPGALPSPVEGTTITWPVLTNTDVVLNAMKTPSALITANWSFDTSSLVPEVAFLGAYAPALEQCTNKKARIWQIEKYMGKKDTAIPFTPTDTSACWGPSFPGISNNSVTDLGIRALQNGTRYYSFITWRP